MTPEITRTVDELGRISIPRDLLKELGWHGRSKIEISLKGDTLVLRAAKESGEVREGDGKTIAKIWL